MQKVRLFGVLLNSAHKGQLIFKTFNYREAVTENLNCVCFSTTCKRFINSGPKMTVKNAYTLLNLQEGCSEEELRDSYIRLAKHYHPDSGASTADARKFSQVKEAYSTIKNQMASGEAAGSDELDDYKEGDIDFNIKHTVPQHRQYLSYEGVGMGTPIQRQKQYQQIKAIRATDRVHEHRMKKIAMDKETAMVVKEKEKIRKVKVSNVIDRLVEDLIQESMHKGDFDNLPGKGQPLDYTERNPLVDTMTHNLNKILINNGYAPEWITLEKDIRIEMRENREKLAKERYRLGDPPFTPEGDKRWNYHAEKFKATTMNINDKIEKFNLIVPIFQKQMLPFNLERECRRIYEEYVKYLPDDLDENSKKFEHSPIMTEYYKQSGQSKTDWKDVWKNIRDVFFNRA